MALSAALTAAVAWRAGPAGWLAWRGVAAAAAAAPANAMALVKELRSASGAPITDVKACLAASNWDMEAAMEALRLKGLAAAVKKASRHAAEGLVAVQQAPDSTLVAVVEINSETDFVGRSEPFQQLVGAAAAAALRLGGAGQQAAAGVQALDAQQLAGAQLDSGATLQEGCALLAGQVRENIALRRGWLVAAGSHGVVSSYVHAPAAPGAGRIAAVVGLSAPGSTLQQEARAELSQLASQLAMHSAGMNTQHISQQAMQPEMLEAARADFASQTEALMPDKPAQMRAKVVEGKLAKWAKESCLLTQPFVLDDSLTVQQLLQQKARELGLAAPLQVSALLRVQVGEGLQREAAQPDFAAEVAAMAGGA